MSDTIGRVTVLSVTAVAVFPLRTEFPHGCARKRTVITHQFGSANAKIKYWGVHSLSFQACDAAEDVPDRIAA